jgi:acyl-[acyl-carrier-protein] desaturase
MEQSDMVLMESLQGFVEQNLNLLLPVDEAWQPTDLLPDLTGEDWSEQLGRFRTATQGISDELLVILVGNMVTEEALPNYAISLNSIAKDNSGISECPWAKWLRGWTAEENRHGDLLNSYLRLTGRVDMRSVELTIHHLIRNGFSPKSHGDDYAGLIYASFQERATRITHANVGKLAAQSGDDNLAKICRKIAGDEARHETFYTRAVAQIMQQDPEGGVLAFRSMLKGVVAMPGRHMFDGSDPNLFDHFGAVTQRLGVYTARTYSQIIDHLNKAWGIADLKVSDKAARAQDYLCRQPERYEFFADEIAAKTAELPPVNFSWINGCPA